MKISIPEPCHEDWNAMAPVDFQRRHCVACDRTLTDFTEMADAEIGRHLRHNSGKICGRISTRQLNRKLALSGARNYGGARAVAAAAGLLLAVPAVGQGVQLPPTELSLQINKQLPGDSQSGNSKGSVLSENVTITGVVTDDSGEPLIGASILVVGTTIGTITGFDGEFYLKVSTLNPVKLKIGYIGFATMEVEIDKATMQEYASSTLVLEVAPIPMEEMIMGIIIRRRSLAHRIFVAPVNRYIVWPAKQAVRDIGNWRRGRFDRREARQLRRDNRRAIRVDNVVEETTTLISKGKVTGPLTTVAPIDLNFAAAPNPFTDHLQVGFSLAEQGSYRLELYGASGKLVKSWEGLGQAGPQDRVLGRDLGNLATGMYFLELTTKEGTSVITLVR